LDQIGYWAVKIGAGVLVAVYSLLWDQIGYWAVKIGAGVLEAIHVIGLSLTSSNILQVNQAIVGIHGVDVQFAGIKFLESLVCNT